MRAAVLTASPQRSYWNVLEPITPAIADPEWMPTWQEKVMPYCCSSRLMMFMMLIIAKPKPAMPHARSSAEGSIRGLGKPAATR